MTKKPGFKVHPAFVKNGVEVNKIYLSAYEGSLYDVSASAYILMMHKLQTSQQPQVISFHPLQMQNQFQVITQDLTRRKCGILAENRGTGWSQQYAATAACSQASFHC
jgi:hypothetical protein